MEHSFTDGAGDNRSVKQRRPHTGQAGFIDSELKIISALCVEETVPDRQSGAAGSAADGGITQQYIPLIVGEVVRFDGIIVESNANGLLAFFGVPVSHENHAQRACFAALAVRNALDLHELRHNLRVMVSTGKVLLQPDADTVSLFYDEKSEVITQLNALRSSASGCGVYVDGQTAALCRDYFDFEHVQPTASAAPSEAGEEAYELRGRRGPATRIEASIARGLTTFTGRGSELMQLHEVFASVRQGAGVLVDIEGEAGVGKSRLLYEFRKSLSDDSCRYLEGRCFSYGETMIYLPVLNMLRGYFDISEEDDADVVKRRIRETVNRLDSTLLAAVPSLLDLFSVPADDADFAGLDPQEKRERIFEDIAGLLAREGRQQPVVLAIEDVQWIDRSSADFLQYLFARLSGMRLMLIRLYRPECAVSNGALPEQRYKLRIGQLSDVESLALVRGMLAESGLDEEITRLLLDRTGGNPFFLEELTHSLVESGSIRKLGGKYVAGQHFGESDIPATVQGLIASRIDRLEHSLKNILQVASVIGREFLFRMLQAISGMHDDLRAGLAKLERLEFVCRKAVLPELEYVFRHALTQEVAYTSMLQHRRRELHERTAQAIEKMFADRIHELAELLAYHFTCSGNSLKALHYLEIANRKAVSAFAVSDALAFYRRAMSILETIPDTQENRERRIALTLGQKLVYALCNYNIVEFYRLLKRFEKEVPHTGNPALQGSYYESIAMCEFCFGNLKSALEKALAAAELCEASGNGDGAFAACLTAQWCCLYMADYETMAQLEARMRTLHVDDHNGYLFCRMRCNSVYGHCSEGDWRAAIETAREAQTLCTDGNVYKTADVLCCMVYMYSQMGDDEKAEQYRVEMEGYLPFVRKEAQSLDATGALAESRSGNAAGAVVRLERAVEMLEGAQFFPLMLHTKCWLGEAYMHATRYDRAESTLQEVLSLARRCGSLFFEGLALRLLGETALQSGRENVHGYFQKAIDIFTAHGCRHDLALALEGSAKAALREGNTEKAKSCFAEALNICERIGTLGKPDEIRAALSTL